MLINIECSEKVLKILTQLQVRASKKFNERQERYGPSVGDSDFYIWISHLIDEFAELIISLYPNNWRDIIKDLTKRILDKENIEKDPPSVELIDIINCGIGAYVSGDIRGLFDILENKVDKLNGDD